MYIALCKSNKISHFKYTLYFRETPKLSPHLQQCGEQPQNISTWRAQGGRAQAGSHPSPSCMTWEQEEEEGLRMKFPCSS